MRTPVYRFDFTQPGAARGMFSRLIWAGLSPVWERPAEGDGWLITLGPTDALKLRALQQLHPERFGHC